MEVYKFEKISDFIDAVKSGKFKEKLLTIVLDNDTTNFYYDGEDKEPVEIEIGECNGYGDIEPLYKCLFPGAKVEWC